MKPLLILACILPLRLLLCLAASDWSTQTLSVCWAEVQQCPGDGGTGTRHFSAAAEQRSLSRGHVFCAVALLLSVQDNIVFIAKVYDMLSI